MSQLACPAKNATAAPHFTVALLGNPNTGKTTLFNRFSGMRQRVGNYPGVTVEMKTGSFVHHGCSVDVIDLPGTYSLAPRSPDEIVAVNVILGRQTGAAQPAVVISIVDASNLERNLYLTTQAMELGVPVVIALNMIDIAERQGLQIDPARLQERLGVSVVPIQANKGKGLDRLKDVLVDRALASAEGVSSNGSPAGPPFPEVFEREVEGLRDSLGNGTPPFLVRRLLLDIGGYTEACLAGDGHDDVGERVRAARDRLAQEHCKVPEIEARIRYGWIRVATTECVRRPAQRRVAWTDRIDRVLLHKLLGTLVFLAVMCVVFQSIFTWAKPAMDAIDGGKQLLGEVVEGWLPPGPLRSPPRRRGHQRRRKRARLLASDLDSVRLHRCLGRLRLHGPRRILDGQADGPVWTQRQVLHPLTVVGGLRRSGHHGDPSHRESSRPDGDHTRRPAHELFGSAPRLHASDWRFPDGRIRVVGSRPGDVRPLRHRVDRRPTGRTPAEVARFCAAKLPCSSWKCRSTNGRRCTRSSGAWSTAAGLSCAGPAPSFSPA